MTLRPIRAIREINRTLDQLEQAEVRAREEARIELVRSASHYSKRTKQVVDGTMNLSAVLMRAGEVAEAERLLAEARADVKTEERVLLESVQEVEAASATRRERMSRLKLAKMLATTMLGAAVMTFSVVGVAVARYFSEGPPTIRSDAGTYVLSGPDEVPPQLRRGTILLPLGEWTLELSKGQYKRYKRLIDERKPGELRSFLLSLLPPEAAAHLDGLLAEAGLSPAVRSVEAEVADATNATGEIVAAMSAPTDSSTSSSGSTSSSTTGGAQKGEKKEKRSDGQEEGPGTSGCEDEKEGGSSQTLELDPVKALQEGCTGVGDPAVTAD